MSQAGIKYASPQIQEVIQQAYFLSPKGRADNVASTALHITLPSNMTSLPMQAGNMMHTGQAS